ncbi:hypothetical protein IP88_03260 [alpha proteobacterium AAP81b]|nr:hypothetical protein IP88_03260 [alpha proteobacterium AAP81b]
MKTSIALAALGAASFASAAGAVVIPAFQVSYESEAPGIQSSTSTFSAVGVETFSSRTPNNDVYQTFATDFGGSGVFSGTYTNAEIRDADQYGGAGGSGPYAVAFSSSGYSLDLTTTLPRGVNYFGYWLSALDGGNHVSFYSGNRLLFTFNPQDVRNAVNATANPGAYFGNPNAAFTGQNTGEPYLFLNFYSNLRPFTRVVFTQTQGGGYESDNHTVGRFLTQSGTLIPLTGSTVGEVPEPASWMMLIAGFGLVGASARRRRVVAA